MNSPYFRASNTIGAAPNGSGLSGRQLEQIDVITHIVTRTAHVGTLHDGLVESGITLAAGGTLLIVGTALVWFANKSIISRYAIGGIGTISTIMGVTMLVLGAAGGLITSYEVYKYHKAEEAMNRYVLESMNIHPDIPDGGAPSGGVPDMGAGGQSRE